MKILHLDGNHHIHLLKEYIMGFTAKELINNNKDFLEKNDLAGFYKAIYDTANCEVKAISTVSKFLYEDCGIHLEDYTDCIPSCFAYAPDTWVEDTVFGSTLVIPPTIKEIKFAGLAGTNLGGKGIFCINTNNVESIEDFAFAGTNVLTLRITKELKKVGRDFLMSAGITKLIYESQCDEDLIESIRDRIKREYMPIEMIMVQ